MSLLNTVTLPQGRNPLGWAMVAGQRVPVEIDQQWMHVIAALVQRSGGTSGSDGLGVYLPLIEQTQDDLAAREALRAVDELRNELAGLRSDNQALRGLLDEQANELAALRQNNLRNRIEQLEDRLA